jgi:hypothetical protein
MPLSCSRNIKSTCVSPLSRAWLFHWINALALLVLASVHTSLGVLSRCAAWKKKNKKSLNRGGLCQQTKNASTIPNDCRLTSSTHVMHSCFADRILMKEMATEAS